MEFDKTILLEILDRILRSWWTLVAGICVGAACAVGALHYLPKVYEARTKIFVAPSKIPQDFVRTTVEDDISLRMAALAQSVLSAPYLEKLIQEEFKPVPATQAETERLVQMIRSKVKAQVTGTVVEISFGDTDPKRAANVVNALADAYIEENSRFRATRAEDTTKTILEFAERVGHDLEIQEKKIADFRAAHLYETADRQQANLQMLTSRQRDLEAKQTDLAAARDAVRMYADMEKEFTSSSTGPTPGPTSSREGGRVAALERELKVLKLRYSDEHPQVKAKQREIEEARAAAKLAAESPPTTIPSGPPKTNVAQEQRVEMESQVRDLEAEVRKIREDIALYERRIEMTPQVEQQLADLSKGYDVLKEQYRSYQGKVGVAKSAQELEEARKGEQFEVIEKAIPPTRPVRPVPLMVFGMGLVGGIVVFLGPLVIATILRPLINSEAGLRALSAEVPLLVSIPRLPAPETILGDRRRRLTNIGLSVISVAVLATAVLVLG